MPLVSILTPAYNASATLAQAIESVRSQSVTDWEMIIVDDYSSDGTTALASHYAQMDERIRIIRRAEQGGMVVARNQAMAAATGRYIAFLDADDAWLPRKLELQLAFMEEHRATIACTAYRRFALFNQPKRVLRTGRLRLTFDNLLRHNPIGLLTVMIDRDQSGAFTFDPQWAHHADLAMWLQLTKSGHDVYFYDRDLARLRVRPARLFGPVMDGWRLWRIYRDVASLPASDALVALFCHGVNAVIRRI